MGVAYQTHHTSAGTPGAKGGGGDGRGMGGRTGGVEEMKEQGRWERGEDRQSVRVGGGNGGVKGREGKGREGSKFPWSIYPASVNTINIPELSKCTATNGHTASVSSFSKGTQLCHVRYIH